MIGILEPRTISAPPEQLRQFLRTRRWLAAQHYTPASWQALKRMLDVVVGSLTLVVSLPLCLAIAAAIKIVSPGPIFFVQERVGKDGRLFKLYKFRTMIDGAHLLHKHVAHLNACDGPALKIPNDPRLHVLGKFLRRSSLDELPQLWNVLCGEMSLVGPRPALPLEVERYVPHYHQRFTVLPGITGVWQVSGRTNVAFRRWMAMDVWYARNWSPFVDIWVLWKTIPAVIRREGAW
jgi:lipopolysaccharide/colanic/teichoic acid biosynthesis glycosyltransferase